MSEVYQLVKAAEDILFTEAFLKAFDEAGKARMIGFAIKFIDMARRENVTDEDLFIRILVCEQKIREVSNDMHKLSIHPGPSD